MRSIVAVLDGRIVGNVTVVADPLSWSPHVAEIRLVILPEMRGQGLGRVLAETGFALAVGGGAEKVVAQATVDQVAAYLGVRRDGLQGRSPAAESGQRPHRQDARYS